MDTNFNLNHEGNTIEEIIKNSPTEHGTMITALMMTIAALTKDETRKDEKKKDKHLRLGFMMGTLNAIALSAKDDKDLDVLHKNSGMVEGLLKLATDEVHMVAWAHGANDILNGNSMSYPACKSDGKAKPEVKVKIMKMNKDGSDPEVEAFDDLPDEVKEAIRKLAKNI